MDISTSLQIPDSDWSQPGPSSSRPVRPASAAVVNTMSPPSSKKRASHSVTTSHNQQKDESAPYRDVYSHPAAIAFANAHPRRTIPKFGPYLLLQTLGEGEFGKVKLGLHGQWGEEVAVKLIRRGNVDNPLRMSKVEREIEVLRNIKHPNIVRLYDVIETDKYIGIILEYASGGELFDHILAHRYLKEKDACKLFAQLISGVSYIHAKKIVHRDLKLENLLLDRNRNVIITDFGFANRFEHRADDLMQTSCGSPCYAAPELVISEGLYVGSAVDIWSCGVILYAMLAGYLPFDDDPANPEGDNINLLYKYIVNTALTFPDYVSPDARDLLSMMLVPDPKRRSGLPEIMAHRWLAPYSHLFERSVVELERIALEQQNLKRQAYQRQMRTHADGQREPKMPRNYSDAPPPSSSRPQELIYQSPVPELPATASAPTPHRRAVASAIVSSSTPIADEDPFVAPSPVTHPTEEADSTARRSRRSKSKESSRSKRSHKDKEKQPAAAKSPEKDASGTGSRRKKQQPYRHTIQLEYNDDAQPPAQQDVEMVHVSDFIPPSPRAIPDVETPSTPKARNGISSEVVQPSTSLHVARPTMELGTSPPRSSTTSQRGNTPTPTKSTPQRPQSTEPTIDGSHRKAGSGSTGSSGSRHRKGLSMDKFGFGKILGKDASDTEHVPPKPVPQDEKPKNPVSDTGTVRSKSRRNTLSLMVEPLSRSIKERSTKNRSVTVEPKPKDRDLGQEVEVEPPRSAAVPDPKPTPVPFKPFNDTQRTTDTSALSSLSAKSVMSWFRSRSLSKRDVDPMASTPAASGFTMVDKPPTSTMGSYVGATGASSSSTFGQPTPVQVIVTTPSNQVAEPPSAGSKWARSPSESIASPGPRQTLANIMRNVTGVGVPASTPTRNPKFDNSSLRIHRGAVDQATVTSGAPPDVFAHVTKVLQSMGLEVQKEDEFKYRCIRPKKPKSASGKEAHGKSETSNGYTAFTMVGSAASNGVDKRGLPMPSHNTFSGTGGMLRGLLMRRQSSHVSAHAPVPHISPSAPPSSYDTEPDSLLSDSSVLPEALPVGGVIPETIYGDRLVDQGDEVRFSVELTRIDRLEDTLSLDIRRLKGSLRSYKFLYDTLRERCNFAR